MFATLKSRCKYYHLGTRGNQRTVVNCLSNIRAVRDPPVYRCNTKSWTVLTSLKINELMLIRRGILRLKAQWKKTVHNRTFSFSLISDDSTDWLCRCPVIVLLLNFGLFTARSRCLTGQIIAAPAVVTQKKQFLHTMIVRHLHRKKTKHPGGCSLRAPPAALQA